MTYDATHDYVTCSRCRRVRQVDEPVCPTCAQIDRVENERFGRIRKVNGGGKRFAKHPRKGRL